MRRLTMPFVILLSAGSILAQDTIPMSLEECLRIGMERSKILDAARAKAEGSLSTAEYSRSSLYPSLKMSAGYSRVSDVPDFQITIPSFPSPRTMVVSEPVLDNYSIKWTLQQPLFTGWRLSAKARSNLENYRADSSELIEQSREVSLNIRILYWKLYLAAKVKELAEENVSLLEEHLKDIDNLVQQGMATDNDRLKVRLQLSNANLMLIGSENDLSAAGIQLNNYIGQALAYKVLPTSGPDTIRITPSGPSELEAKAWQLRTDLRTMRSRRDAAQFGKKAAQAGWYPQIYAVGNYTYANPNQRIFPAKDQFDGTWDLGVMLTMDIWDWQSTKYQVRQARAVLRQAEDRLSLAEDAIRVEISLCLLDVEKAGQKIDVTRVGLAQAEENHRNVRNLFLQGMATNSDLLDAEVLLLQARVNSTGAAVEYQIVKDRLKKAIGEI